MLGEVLTAIVTPFREDGAVDLEAFRSLCAFLLDNGSHNGTGLAGKPVLAARPAPLHSGDLVTFGAITLRLVDAAELHQLLTRLFAVRQQS
jgi:pSer/pThr/pTyr-binding forkhead associated (FHA) protein